jgi:hypothetical protein
VAQHGFVDVLLAAEKFGDRLAGAVVVGWAEASGGDDYFGAVHGMLERRAHLVRRITDDGFVDYADAELIEFGG